MLLTAARIGAAVAAALVTSAAAGAIAPTAEAAPGDVVVEVQTFSMNTTGGGVHQQTVTTMCPGTMRATGGGAAPVSPAGGGQMDNYRIHYSAPVDSSGLAGSTDDGDVPRGWQVSISTFTNAPTEDFKAFALCSAGSDAVIAADQPPVAGTFDHVTPCPSGTRAIGGGMGKVNDIAIGSTQQGPLVYASGPVDESRTVAGTGDGDVAAGWRTVADGSSFGNRFFAICSAASDATVQEQSFVVPQDANTATSGSGAATCPDGQRVLSGGLSPDTPLDVDDRLEYGAPVGANADLATVASGTVARSWLASGQSSSSQNRTYHVYALCTADPDTTPPATVKESGPAKQITKHTARFAFSSEPDATFRCKLDARAWKACTSPTKVTNLTLGKHVFKVAARDQAGNTDPTPATWSFKVVRSG